MTPAERYRRKVMIDDMGSTTFRRRLFRTERGFMGLGPVAARIGDKVCVLLGGQVLYVLRDRDEGCYEFVGECYVHGMMDGQALEDEEFQIRLIILL